MTSLPMRDPKQDRLIAPGNSALVIIDYQPLQMYTVQSMERGRMINNMIALTRLAKVFDMPIVLSTVNVSNGMNPDTVTQLRSEIPDVRCYDRTQINAWEDQEFQAAVKAAGRQKLIMCALWTEVVDAVGGTTIQAHKTALRHMTEAGARPTTWNSVACQLQRDWARQDTVKGFMQTVIEQNQDWGWYEELRGSGNQIDRNRVPVGAGSR